MVFCFTCGSEMTLYRDQTLWGACKIPNLAKVGLENGWQGDCSCSELPYKAPLQATKVGGYSCEIWSLKGPACKNISKDQCGITPWVGGVCCLGFISRSTCLNRGRKLSFLFFLNKLSGCLQCLHPPVMALSQLLHELSGQPRRSRFAW